MSRTSALGRSIGVVWLVVVLAGSATGAQASSRTVRASVDTAGGDPNSISETPSISANGRYVAFESAASDLVPGDGNSTWDVFVRDMVAGTTVRASVDPSGGDGNDMSYRASISANGRFVAFQSLASNLVAGDGNDTWDVFIRNLAAGSTTRVSVDMSGGDSNGASSSPSMSASGRSVAFQSSASDLITGDGNIYADIFLRGLGGGTTRVSVDTLGGDPNNNSFDPSISADGLRVAFASDANNLAIPYDGNSRRDVYVRDIPAETTVRASLDLAGGDGNNDSYKPSINANGQKVAFESWATDLVPGDGNATEDIFLRDLPGGSTTRVSVDTAGGDPDAHSELPSISGDGAFVAFESYASDLIIGDGNAYDVFVRNVAAGTTTRVAVDMSGGDPNHNCFAPSMTPDSKWVAFGSYASDLVRHDGNGNEDVFVVRGWG